MYVRTLPRVDLLPFLFFFFLPFLQTKSIISSVYDPTRHNKKKKLTNHA